MLEISDMYGGSTVLEAIAKDAISTKKVLRKQKRF
jgi:hypothetical protein